MKQETYRLRVILDGNEVESATFLDKNIIDALVLNTERIMKNLGYAKTNFMKVRIDSKHMTVYTIECVRR